MGSLTQQLAVTWWQMQLRKAVRTMPALVVALAVGFVVWLAWLLVRTLAVLAWRGARIAGWMVRAQPRVALTVLPLPLVWLVPAWWVVLSSVVGLTVTGIIWRRTRPESWRVAVTLPAQVAHVRSSWRRVATACLRGSGGRLPGVRSSLTERRPAAPQLPRITRAEHTNNGRRLNLVLSLPTGMIARDLTADIADRIAAAYGARTASVSEPRLGMAVLSLTLPGPTDTAPAITASFPTRITIGTTEHGDPWQLPTGQHMLTAGVTGSGKGSVMWSSLAALAPHIEAGALRVAGIDLKGGMELAHGRALFTEWATTPAEAGALLAKLAGQMTERATRMAGKHRTHTPTEADPAWLIVIDELAMITAYVKDSKLRAQIGSDLAVLLSQGRAPGYTVWAFLQDPAKDVLEVRQHFPIRIALRLMEATQTAMMLGNGSGAECHLIDPTLPGTGYVRTEDGTVVKVRATYQSDEQIHELADRHAPVPTPVDTDAQSVYFVAEDKPEGRIKIGIAQDVRQRLRTLRTASSDPLVLLGVMPGGRRQEQRLHRQFGHARTHGEWFDPHPDLIAYIEKNADREGVAA